ncbi:MAG: PLP-dependent aminotransferase family protein [Eubacteriales bacterium]|nr:PLP-dependent aminotransferase family protein [Eubacteriales bacterium]MDD4390294.1 PLP-dependent aminotransferase family protein [Eubacteriales bacterium]
MPINSFDNYVLNWKPNKDEIGTPIYRSLALLMEADIKSGKLLANTKLPPQRELADYLDLNHSTITKAYKICERKGLIHAVIGNGTFVSPNANIPSSIVNQDDTAIADMGMVLPFFKHNHVIKEIAREVLKRPLSEKLFEYSNPLGSYSQRMVGADWVSQFGVDCSADNMIIEAGAQNALAITLSSLFSPGDKIATDPYTYPNLIALAGMLHIQLVAVKSDDQGMLPNELDSICSIEGIQGIYVMTSCNNPTTTALSEQRIKDISYIAKKYQLLIVEDDAFAFLRKKKAIPFCALLPEQTVYISSLSKSICAGIRVAYMHFPQKYFIKLEEGCYNINIKAPSLNVEVMTEIIRIGVAKKLAQEKRKMAISRNRLYSKIFPSAPCELESYYQWLQLPEGCSGRSFEELMMEKKIKVFGAERFSVGESTKSNAIRIATCSPTTEEQLEFGLLEIKNVL